MSERPNMLEHAAKCFERLKENYQAEGAKLTISAVAKAANIDRKYFYGLINTPNAEYKQAWRALGERIKDWNLRRRNANPTSFSNSLSDTDKLQNALVENFELLEKVGELEFIKSALEKQLEVLRAEKNVAADRIRILEARTLRSEQFNNSVVSLHQQSVIISPDRFVSTASRLDQKAAWVRSLDELRAVLARPVEKDLYVTIGIPGSGKTFWSSSFRSVRRMAVILDACNLTRIDRYEIMHIAKNTTGLKSIAVVFLTSLDVALKRNSIRTDISRVPDEVIRQMSDDMEFPDLEDIDEGFDEVVFVRGKNV